MKPSITCAMCGTMLADTHNPADLLANLNLPRRRRQIFEKLVERPAGVSVKDLIWHLYGDDPDGGPVDAEGCVDSHISYLRKALMPYGWAIPRRRYGVVRLKRIQKPAGRRSRRNRDT